MSFHASNSHASAPHDGGRASPDASSASSGWKGGQNRGNANRNGTDGGRSGQFEALLFGLGNGERYAVNVFKARELITRREITKIPGQPEGVLGVLSIRGDVLPVLDLAGVLNVQPRADDSQMKMMIITEFAGHNLVMLVEQVYGIVSSAWDRLQPAEKIIGGEQALISSVLKLQDESLASVIDLEQIVTRYTGLPEPAPFDPQSPVVGGTVLFADDSKLAREQVRKVLESLGLKSIEAVDGADALNRIREIQQLATSQNASLTERIQAIITDVEMPNVDGYELTRTIKADPALRVLPVVLYSSLPTPMSEVMGRSAGADVFVPKFEVNKLADGITRVLT